MLQPHEIFAKMPQVTALGLIQFLHENEKPLYKATVNTLAQQKKLRPVFIERKPRSEQYLWMKDQVSRKTNEALAAHLLQIWLVGAHKHILCEFLDGFQIPHDENGTIETLPDSPTKAEVARVVDSLLTKYDPAVVAVYLHAFQSVDDKGWSGVEELLKEDPRLQLGA